MDYFKKVPFFLIFLIGLVYIALFSYYNQGYIDIEAPYLGNFKLPTALLVLFSFVIGSLFSMGYFVVELTRKSLEIRSLSKQLKNLRGTSRDQVSKDPVSTEPEKTLS